MKEDREVKEAEITDARVWVNFPGSVALRRTKEEEILVVIVDREGKNMQGTGG